MISKYRVELEKFWHYHNDVCSNPTKSDINVNHEIINALEIEIDDLSNETQSLQKQIQRFTACQECNSNFEKVNVHYQCC